MQPYPPIANLLPGVITLVRDKDIRVYLRGEGIVTVAWPGLAWAAGQKTQASDFLKRGDMIYLNRGKKDWELAQVPELEGAIVALDPYDGAIAALDGGFSFTLSKYNRAVQAHRQLGSSFKPFVYSAALNAGMTPATLISNAPFISVANPELSQYWRPRNAERETSGMMRLREALVHSVNIVSVRILQQLGVTPALDWARRFGFSPSELPHNLTLALGSASLTPLSMARGYAVFANGGFLVRPYFIERIEGPAGKVLAEAHPWVACAACSPAAASAANPLASPVAATTPSAPESAPVAASAIVAASAASSAQTVLLIGRQPRQPRLAPRTLSAQNAYLMTDILHSVILSGTGIKALALKRQDIAGKTGTTNDTTDAWFDGFGPRLVTVAWVGFDQPQTMGHGWTGAHAALPMWISFMGEALNNVPEAVRSMPPGLVTARIDSKTGLRCGPDDPDAIWEVFREKELPPMQQKKQAPSLYGGGGGTGGAVRLIRPVACSRRKRRGFSARKDAATISPPNARRRSGSASPRNICLPTARSRRRLSSVNICSRPRRRRHGSRGCAAERLRPWTCSRASRRGPQARPQAALQPPTRSSNCMSLQIRPRRSPFA